MTHVAFYAGWSKATKAMRTVTRVLGKERRSEDGARILPGVRLLRAIWRRESLLTQPGDISHRCAPEEAAVFATEL